MVEHLQVGNFEFFPLVSGYLKKKLKILPEHVVCPYTIPALDRDSGQWLLASVIGLGEKSKIKIKTWALGF